MLLSSTLALFTSTVSSGTNVVTAGNLKIELQHDNAFTTGYEEVLDGEVTEEGETRPKTRLFVGADGNDMKWEPGAVTWENFRILNVGDLALLYQFIISTANENYVVNADGTITDYGLSQVLKVGIVDGGLSDTQVTSREATIAAVNEWKLIADFTEKSWAKKYTNEAVLPEKTASAEPGTASEIDEENGTQTADETGIEPGKGNIVGVVVYWEPTANDNNYNVQNGKTTTTTVEGQPVDPLRIDLGIQVIATQAPDEEDSFGKDYDAEAANEKFQVEFPKDNVNENTSVDIPADKVEGNVLKAPIILKSGQVTATVPAGVLLDDGVEELTMTITELNDTNGDIQLGENEESRSLDVHIGGVSADNTVPIIIDLGEVMPAGLNMGSATLYHVQADGPAEMTQADSTEEVDEHNEFYYNPENGSLAIGLATFSEVALVADTENAWEGSFDYTWYTKADGDSTASYTLANADQLAAFGAIVGGMDGQTRDSFKDKTVRLINDINLGDAEKTNNPDIIFYPIGYYNSEGTYEKTNTAITSGLRNFEGIFDGNGHTISNFYQNTWEMKGDHDWYDATLQYYRDGMGLFGKVYGGIVKNLTVDNFSSDGEIATTGVIAAYADGATFENIAITNCNPRVYNIGNGGIVGCVGWYAKEADLKTTFKNITVDNSNKISALWGSYDVACGGLVGQYYPTSGQTSASSPKNAGVDFENCHVAAIMDVYNDVCGNYQYYAYRYAGMMIGSIRENTTNENGKTIPDMTGISATGCTVNYGDWNDYYYCEFEKNGHPSYSGPDDYKFSRVPHSELNFTDSNDNGLVDADERASVTGCKHNHTDAENNQAIYLPFHQLFTGYSWGVSSIGLKEYSGIVTDLGITEGDQEESVEKFEKVEAAENSYVTGTTVNIDDLFKADENADVAIDVDNVQVTVSPVGDDSTAGATYTANTSDWTQGTLTFSGIGAATITITDYYFCTPTTIEVTVEPVDKFRTVFENTDKYLYRVGNKNTVALGSLFEELPEVEVGNVKVSVEALNRASVSGTYTANATDWASGTIQFSGTGPVEVTISDETSTEYTLNLEVVDAYNATIYSELKNQNSVLLDNIVMPTGAYYLSGSTLYGNGFKFDCTNAAYNGSGSVSENYIIGLTDAHLDNVEIIGAVYTEYGAQASNDYNRALVVSKGDSTITNCYLSNTASPVRLVEGNLAITGSTLKGGNFANIDVRNGHLTIEDITTINQENSNDKAIDGTTVVGLGIVVYYENVDIASTSIDINGTLKQYNHISQNNEFTNDYANQLVSKMFSDEYSDFQYGESPKWVNTGIISMTEGMNDNIRDNRNDTAGYDELKPEFYGRTGYVYTVKPDANSTIDTPVIDNTNSQSFIAPEYHFDYTNNNYIAKTEGSNDYCYYENGKVLISMDQGDTFEWDPFILIVTKFGNSLAYEVVMDGKTYSSGNKISFNESGDYVVTYTYTDDNNYTIDESGNLQKVSRSYTKTVNISVSVIKPTTQHAAFTFADTNTNTEKLTLNDKTYISAKGVSATDKEWGYITVNGTKIFYPITEAQMKKNMLGTEVQVYYYVFKDAVTITDYKDGGTGSAESYDSSTTTMPSNLAVVNGMEAKYTDINSACVDISKLTKDGPSGEVWDFSASTTVSGTTKYNNYLAHSSPSGLSIKSGTRDYDAITVAQFSYTDEAGATYYYFVGYFMPNQVSSGSSGDNCITPDTLITLADGSQKRVDELTGDELLLVWNLETGGYDVAPIVFVDNDAEAAYNVIHLNFSDNSEVKVIYEHGFFDIDMGEYVYITEENCADYIGHRFVKQGDMDENTWEVVTLNNAYIETEVTTAWSPVTAEHLCYYTNGVLSMPGGIEGLFNIFEVDTDIMAYDAELMVQDIEQYGLFTYEDFDDMIPESAYEVFNGDFLKVAIGKGMLTWDDIAYLAERYVPLM